MTIDILSIDHVIVSQAQKSELNYLHCVGPLCFMQIYHVCNISSNNFCKKTHHILCTPWFFDKTNTCQLFGVFSFPE